MTKLANISVFFWVVLIAASCSSGQAKMKKALFIIADGIPADVIEKAATPALDAISKEGGYARAFTGGEKDGYSQTPTISAVGYNSLLTGTWVNKHNVWDNDIKQPNYHYQNIFRFFKTQYPEKKMAVFSTWLDNRTKLIGSEAKETGNLQPDYYFDGLENDTISYPHDTLSGYIHLIDEAVTDTAAAVISRVAPDLSWVYLQYTDDMGHRYGNSKQMNDAVAIMDQQIQRVWDAVQYREKHFNEEWQVWITTDHGREENGYHHGGQSERERTTWIVTNAKDLNGRFLKQQAAIVDIMPSMVSFLNIAIPKEQLMEIDGISLTGKISATDPRATLSEGSIDVKWEPVGRSGNAKVWYTVTNNFSTGGRDEYKLAGEVPVAEGSFKINLEQNLSDFYKVVIELPYNYLNRWVMAKR